MQAVLLPQQSVPHMKRLPLLTAFALLLTSALSGITGDPAPTGFETTIVERRDWLIEDVREFFATGDSTSYHRDPKRVTAVVVPRTLGEVDNDDLREIFFGAATHLWFLSNSGNPYFTYMGQTRLVFVGGHWFDEAATFDQSLLGSTLMQDDPFGYVRQSIDFYHGLWNNNGTENHRLMTWTSAYLFAQAFPGQGPWDWDGNVAGTDTAQEVQDQALARITEVGKRRYANGGNSEMLSPIYEIFHFIPILNLYQFAADPDSSAVGEAFLLLHSANLALHSFEGHLLAPWSRQGTQRNRGSVSDSQAVLWYYFGLPAIDRLFESNTAYLGHLAASTDVEFPNDWTWPYREWRMPETVQYIATEKFPRPYTTFSNQPFFQHSPARQTMRINYVDNEFAVGSGNVRHSPSAFYLDDAKFEIVYTSPEDSFNYIQAFHPYWRSDAWETGDFERAWTGPTSPFMQLAQHEDTVIALFGIPQDDPYAGIGQWQNERDGVAPQSDENDPTMEQVGATRFPKEIDEWLQDGDWFFLREDDVFIGIKVLKPGATVNTTGLADFNQILSEEAETGFVYEVGTAAEFGTFAAFQVQLKSNPLVVDFSSMEVTYTNTSGDVLFIRYNAETAGLDSSVPEVSVNGTFYDWENWPAIESPWVTLANSVLTIESENETIVSDWSGQVPVITREYRLPAPAAKMVNLSEVELTVPTIFGTSMRITRSEDGVNFDTVVAEFIGDGNDFVDTFPRSGDRAFYRSEVVD